MRFYLLYILRTKKLRILGCDVTALGGDGVNKTLFFKLLYFLGCGNIDDADTVIIHVDLLMSALILAVRSVDYDFGNELVDKFGSKLLYLGNLFNLGNKLFNICF